MKVKYRTKRYNLASWAEGKAFRADTESGAGNKLRSLLEKLVSERKAEVVIEHVDGYIKVYSVAEPPVAVVSGYLVDETNFFTNYIIGREEDVKKFEDTYKLNCGGFGKRIVQEQ